MISVNPDLLAAMQAGAGQPIARLRYTDANNDHITQDIIAYEFDRLACTVRVPHLSGQEIPSDAAFYIERGLQLAATEHTLNAANYYLDSYAIDEQSNAITYRGQILPPAAVNVANAAQSAQTVITAALTQAGITASFPSGGDDWYTWQFDRENKSLSLANIQTLLAIIRKKYIATVFPRANGLTFGHPGTFAADQFTDYAPAGFVTQTPLRTATLQLTATDQSDAPRTIGADGDPIHAIGFLHTDVTDAAAEAIAYIISGGDSFEQRPDFRLEHGDKLAPPAGSRYLGTACLEYREVYKRDARRPVWKQIVSPIEYQTRLAVSPILKLATPTRIYFNTSADPDPDKSGNPASTVDSAVRISGDEAALTQRLIPNAVAVDHFDRNNIGLWTWQSQAATASGAEHEAASPPDAFSMRTYPSTLTVKDNKDAEIFLTIPFDSTRLNFFALVQHIEHPQSYTQVGVTLINNTLNKYVRGIWRPENSPYTAILTSNSTSVNATIDGHEKSILSLEISGTPFTNWTASFYHARPWTGPAMQRTLIAQIAGLNWTPEFVGILMYKGAFAIDAAGWLSFPTPRFPSSKLVTHNDDFLITHNDDYLVTHPQD